MLYLHDFLEIGHAGEGVLRAVDQVQVFVVNVAVVISEDAADYVGRRDQDVSGDHAGLGQLVAQQQYLLLEGLSEVQTTQSFSFDQAEGPEEEAFKEEFLVFVAFGDRESLASDRIDVIIG